MVQFDPKALRFMATMTGGLPVVAHEIGDAVFRSTSKYPVDSKAATLGVHIAASVVGHKYLQPQIVESLQSEQYREILRIPPHRPTHSYVPKVRACQPLAVRQRRSRGRLPKANANPGRDHSGSGAGSRRISLHESSPLLVLLAAVILRTQWTWESQLKCPA